MLEILAGVIEEPFMEDMKSYQAIRLEMDETMDVSKADSSTYISGMNVGAVER